MTKSEIRDKQIRLLSIIFEVASSRDQLWKTVKLNSFQKPYFQSVSIFFFTLIDLIFTSHQDNILCSGVTHVGISDHSLVYAYRKISIPPVSKGINLISYRQFKHFNSNNFRNDVSTQPWDDIKELYDPNDMWKKWKELFLSVCDKHAPVKTKRTRPTKSPWITTNLKKRMNFRNRLKKKAVKTKDASSWNRFRKVKNKVNQEIKAAKKAYYNNSPKSCSPYSNVRHFWL